MDSLSNDQLDAVVDEFLNMNLTTPAAAESGRAARRPSSSLPAPMTVSMSPPQQPTSARPPKVDLSRVTDSYVAFASSDGEGTHADDASVADLGAPIGAGGIEDMVDSILSSGGGGAGLQPSTRLAPADNRSFGQRSTRSVAILEDEVEDRGEGQRYTRRGSGVENRRPSAAEVESVAQPQKAQLVSSRGGTAPKSAPAPAAVRADPEMMLRRMKLWGARKQRNLEAKRENVQQEQAAECTFRPCTAPSIVADLHRDRRSIQPSTLYRDNQAWGFDDFVERQERARIQRDSEAERKRAVFASGTAWQNRTTVPQPFDLGTRRTHASPANVVDGSMGSGGPRPVGAGSSRAMAGMMKQLRSHFDAEPSSIEPPSLPPGSFSTARVGGGRHQGGAEWNAQLDAVVNEFLHN